VPSIAGTWLERGTASFVQISGDGDHYSFQGILLGTVVSSGAIHRTGVGRYQMVGMGINGPVNLQLKRVNNSTLQGSPDMGPLQALAPFMPLPMVTLDRQGPAPEEEAPTPARVRAAPREAGPRSPPRAAPERPAQAPPKASASKEPAPERDPLAELEGLIGMRPVKKQLQELDDWAWRERQAREHGVAVDPPSMHMCFAGGPGTGKTTVARIVGRLLHQHGLLRRSEVLEVGRSDLVADFVGQTAGKTKVQVEKALGGVLFVDEAYALTEPGKGGGQDFGGEALATLVAEMENHRRELSVIVAGYSDEMQRFLDANAGLRSRISRRITFPDFSDAELQLVLKRMLAERSLTAEEPIFSALETYLPRAKAAARPGQWGNARSIRNILDRAIAEQASRLRGLGRKPTREELLALTAADFAFLRGAPSVW